MRSSTSSPTRSSGARASRTSHNSRRSRSSSSTTSVCVSSRTPRPRISWRRSEEHTSELQSLAYLVCRLLLEKKKNNKNRACCYAVVIGRISRNDVENYNDDKHNP